MLATLWSVLNAVIIARDFDSTMPSSFEDVFDNGVSGTTTRLVNELGDTWAPEPSATRPDGDGCAPGCPSGRHCVFAHCVLVARCPPPVKFGPGPPSFCERPADPNHTPEHPAERWFTKDIFDDLFPKANIGWGPSECLPYSYESFRIAMRYFPRFANEGSLKNGYTDRENQLRDLAAFFAHAVQETGENDANLYRAMNTAEAADACFYRGGFFNWFEGGPTSSFLNDRSPGYTPRDGQRCKKHGLYCANSTVLHYWHPCGAEKIKERRGANSTGLFPSCYFGRGAIQLSYNYNYGQFQAWLRRRGIFVDLLAEPNLVITKRDPPLAIMASIWYYMTPQPPKPAMHDIVMGQWEAGELNRRSGYSGPIFGPTSLVINNECNGEDPTEPGGPGESRRIKAFKWFCAYFAVPTGDDRLLTCKGMEVKLEAIRHERSWQPDWATTWKKTPCDCKPASYAGMIPYFAEGFYPAEFVAFNEENHRRCVFSMYDNPSLYSMNEDTSPCLKQPFSVQLFSTVTSTTQDAPANATDLTDDLAWML